MIRMVVIDDEPVIARSIKNLVEQTDSEFVVVAIANDGRTGLRLIEEKNPDLIFVDIRMPVMGGLELLEELKAKNKRVPAVILSGYQEFEYAKRSITLGVLDYLVKPLNPLTLGSFLEQLKGRLQMDQYQKQCQYLRAYIHLGKAKKEGLESLLFDSPKQSFGMIKICIHAYNFVRNNQFAFPEALSEQDLLLMLCEAHLGIRGFWLIEGKYQNEFVLLFPEGKLQKALGQQPETVIQGLYEAVREQLFPRYTVTFVTAEEPVLVSELKGQIDKLETILYYGAIFAHSSLLKERQGTRDLRIEDSGMKKQQQIDTSYLAKFLELGRRYAMQESLEVLFHDCEKRQCTQAELISILRSVLRTCCAQESDYERDFMINLLLVNATNYSILLEKLMDTLLTYIRAEQAGEGTGGEIMIDRIQSYLDEHYQEKIVIQEVAERFGFNYSYLCNLFRKYKQVTPNEYMILKRLGQAKRLLKEREDLNIKDIADLVGYQDQYYFSRIFKTYENMSPKEYRQSGKETTK